MRKRHSRLAATEQKKNIRKAYLYIVLTAVSLVLLFIYGLPAIVKMAGFLGELRQSGEPIGQNDTTPPAPPQIETLPEATNDLSITIIGTSEPGSTVVLFLNNEEVEVVADNDGDFSHAFSLNRGENTVSTKARDSAGNESLSTDEYSILYDNEPPQLEITSPKDGADFWGSKQRQVSIEGTTDEGVSITVNGRYVVVESDGSFVFTTTLQEGENKFEIKAEDKAGNTTDTAITLHFSE